MKVPPKRKGNDDRDNSHDNGKSLNESPSEKEGKCLRGHAAKGLLHVRLNESPSEKEGKFRVDAR